MAERVARVEAVLPLLATKGDVSEAKASIVMWMAGVIAASTAIIVAVLVFAINRANPPQSQQQQAPVVIYPQPVPAPQPNPPASQSPPATKRDQKR